MLFHMDTADNTCCVYIYIIYIYNSNWSIYSMVRQFIHVRMQVQVDKQIMHVKWGFKLAVA